MLIITERHTKEDLELWKDYQENDKIKKYSDRKLELSCDVINKWCDSQDDVCVYTSWGKDSVVLLYLMYLSGMNRPTIYMRFGDRDNPDCLKVRDAYLSKYPLDYHEEFFDYNEVRKSGAHWKAIAKKYGQHRISGIRNDESGKRQLQWILNGFESEYSCRPLSLWSNSEIFAFIEQKELPLSPVYGYLGGGRWKREKLRTHSLAGTSGNGMGRTEWEREYYGDILNRLQAR